MGLDHTPLLKSLSHKNTESEIPYIHFCLKLLLRKEVGKTVTMTALSKISQDALMLDQKVVGNTVDEDDFSSGHGSSAQDPEHSSTRDSESQSGSRTGSSRTGTTGGDEDVDDIRNAMAREETKQVFRLRIVVMIVLFVVACALSYTIYYITRKAEILEFENEFEAVAETIHTNLNGTAAVEVFASIICLATSTHWCF